MASAVDICNLALSHLGQDVTVTDISPSDGSFESDKCEVFYPIARNAMLERHSWGCATRRAALTLKGTNELEGLWMFAYAPPALMIKPLIVLPPESVDDKFGATFEVEIDSAGDKVIYTNQEAAVLKYIKEVSDTGTFTPGMVLTLSWLLASYLAGPITKKREVAEWAYKNFETQFALATADDASGRKTNRLRDYVPGHITARRS